MSFAHRYFDLASEQIFDICQSDLPVLLETVRKMIGDL